MKKLAGGLALVVAFGMSADAAAQRDWYVSIQTGSGKKGTKEKPAKDLGNVISKLEAGDRIFIAEGTYLGRGENGRYLINVPCEVSGGWDVNFETRDPWGAHKTILSGVNKSENWDRGYRLQVDLSKWKKYEKHRVVIDGVIVDNGDRNRYSTDSQNLILRMADPKSGANPTPESGGIDVRIWKDGDIVVRNCIVINTAPTDGAFNIWGHENSKVVVENNLAVNNTGNGFSLHSLWHPRDGRNQPTFQVTSNTSLFNHKHDAFATFGGSALKMESDCVVTATHNVFACNDRYAVDNARRAKESVLSHNLFAASLAGDYLEFATTISLEDIEDECEDLDEAEENVSVKIDVPVSKEWSARYMARSVIDRNAAEADVKADDSPANQLRAMLGLNLQAADLKLDSDVWLPRITLEDAMKAGADRYAGKYGCSSVLAGDSVK